MDRVIHHGEYDETDEENYGWIQWFCSLEDHQFLIEVDENYIRNSHNISDLKHKFDNYYESLRMILSEDSPDSEDIENQQFVELNKSAIDLYGLIHSRYILTEQGLQIMYDKYIQLFKYYRINKMIKKNGWLLTSSWRLVPTIMLFLLLFLFEFVFINYCSFELTKEWIASLPY